MIDKLKVKELLISGKTQREVGKILGCSAANVGRIAKKLGLSLQDFGLGLKLKRKRERFIEQLILRTGRDHWKLDDLARARHQCFLRKRQNNSRWEWEISPQDINWPTHCPILGLELDYFAEKRQENSPSFDRIDSTKGYIKGNIQILSWRANRIKNDGTAEEHLLIATYMKNPLN